ncbi:MAG: cytochrome c oxidase subunit II [Gaiellaceae bacterium]
MCTSRGTKRRRGLAAAALLLPLLLAGCGGAQNSLNPHSHASTDIANLFWWMTGVAFGGLALVSGIMVAAWFRRGRSGTAAHPGEEGGEHLGNKVVIALGIVVPIAVVCALFVVGDTLIIGSTQAPAASNGRLTVHAVGHQWWWEFRYEGTSADTADELHLPVGTRVNLVATTADVIHSFWVPALNRKIDAIPSQRNEISLYANQVGVFRGQCAEFCGLQHAHMGMLVIVQPKAAFRAWLRHEAADARPPTAPDEQAGQKVFLDGPCSSCHTIRGTSASGFVGPDLTHLADRTRLAGLVIRNRRSDLGRWIRDSQHIKPGNDMPDIALTGTQLRDVVAYLESLR